MSDLICIDALFPEINKRAFEFYKDVLAFSGPANDTGVILIAPGYETTFPLVQSLASSLNLRGIIVKNSTQSRNPKVSEALKSAGYPVLGISKDNMKIAAPSTIAAIEKAVHKCAKFVVMDHGGYFAQHPSLLQAFKPSDLTGIAEYTLNGEHRYCSSGVCDRPMISVGQSPLKKASDYAASDAIVLVSDIYVRKGGLMLSSPMNRVGVIGHGRLGGRIRSQLQKLGSKNVLVNDLDQEKLQGLSDRHIARDKDVLFRNCNIIFCATGNHAIEEKDYAKLSNNTVIFTVTSPDDELGLDKLVEERVLIPVPEKQRGDTYIYKVAETGNEIVLPFNGESPNTLLNYGMADPVIHQPCAAHIVAAKRIMQGSAGYWNGMNSLKSEDEKTVMEIWRHHYVRPIQRPAYPKDSSSVLDVLDIK